MSDLRAGFGRQDITPKVGAFLVGYANRTHGSVGVHDPLTARAMVLESAGQRMTVCALELCVVAEPRVAAIRAAVQKRTGIPAANVFISAIHTHSGPDDGDAEHWDRALGEMVADAVEQAAAARQSARIGAAYGVLYGHSINRRWLHRPVDPAVGVIRVDDLAGRPLGLYTNFACHAVVMGSDSYLISADWPGYACRMLEAELDGAVCLFSQGGSADVNPITAGVRVRLTSGHPVQAIGKISTYYGTAKDPTRWNIGDRSGGTFAECEALGAAFADEALRVARGIETSAEVGRLWTDRAMVDVALGRDEPSLDLPDVLDGVPRPDRPAGRAVPVEVMAAGMDAPGIILVGEPGEVFTDTAVTFKQNLHRMGYRFPLVVAYANGSQDYLPPADAFPEGGYEVKWANFMGISRRFQERAWQALQPIAERHVAQPA